jgi:uncharacterized protein
VSGALIDRLVLLFDGLRGAGIGVSMTEVLDAAEALTLIDLADRPLVRTALGASLVKRPEDQATFDLLFDRWFALTAPGTSDRAEHQPRDRAVPAAEVAESTTTSSVTSDAVLDALVEGDDGRIARFASELVDAHGAVDTLRMSERAIVHRVLTAIDLSNMLVRAMRRLRAEHEGDELSLRTLRDDVTTRIEGFRHLVAAEVRRRLSEGVGTPGVGLLAPRRLEDVELASATNSELRELRAAVRPLARKLASRVSQRRRRRHAGRLDVRRTVRRSLSDGGVPLDPVMRRRAHGKPTVVVLCDISGSVSEYARFTLTLIHALSSELAGLRTFVFVDGVVEVTTLLERAEVGLDPRLLATLPGVIAVDGHSDYGEALRRFNVSFPTAVRSTTTVMVVGDARTNERGDGAHELRAMAGAARRVYWLNPEPEARWGMGDSALDRYRPWCDGVFEVRTLRQLADAIAEII